MSRRHDISGSASAAMLAAGIFFATLHGSVIRSFQRGREPEPPDLQE
jgi:hypothetical protein